MGSRDLRTMNEIVAKVHPGDVVDSGSRRCRSPPVPSSLLPLPSCLTCRDKPWSSCQFKDCQYVSRASVLIPSNEDNGSRHEQQHPHPLAKTVKPNLPMNVCQICGRIFGHVRSALADMQRAVRSHADLRYSPHDASVFEAGKRVFSNCHIL